MRVFAFTDEDKFYKGLHPTARPGDTVQPIMVNSILEAFLTTDEEDVQEILHMFPYFKAVPYDLELAGDTIVDLSRRLTSLLSQKWEGKPVKFCALSDNYAVYNFLNVSAAGEDDAVYINLSTSRSGLANMEYAEELLTMAISCGVNTTLQECLQLLNAQTCPTERLRAMFPEFIIQLRGE